MSLRIILNERELFPIQAFFNAISAFEFADVLRHLSQGIGVGINAAQCAFPSDDDPDFQFEGVRFSIFEDDIFIPDRALMVYVTHAAESFLNEHPEQRESVEQALVEFPRRFHLHG